MSLLLSAATRSSSPAGGTVARLMKRLPRDPYVLMSQIRGVFEFRSIGIVLEVGGGKEVSLFSIGSGDGVVK